MAAYGDFAAVYDRLMDDVDYGAWSDYLLRLLADWGAPPPAHVLDCGCGTGALTIPFAKAGHRVTGLDISEDMLLLAQEKARKAGFSNIPFIRQDMGRIALHRPVDAVVSACDGVNYLSSPAAAQGFFRSAYNALRPGGLLLFDVSSRHKLQNVLGDRFLGEDRGDLAYLWQNAYDPDSHLLEMRLTFFRAKGTLYERFTERHVQRGHSERELRNWLESAGFEDIAVCECFTREAPGPEAERLQFCARKGRE